MELLNLNLCPVGTFFKMGETKYSFNIILTLDREVLHLKEDVINKYSRLIYNGYWFSPERVTLQKLIDDTQNVVNGKVRIKLLKGNVVIEGRTSPNSLYDENLSTFEDDDGSYDQRDAEGFIKINSLRLRKK